MLRTLGTSFPTEGPGLSARIRYILEAPASGSSAIMKTSTPIPPIQWEKLRHIRTERGRISTSPRIVAPVVVNPDTISKSASTGLGKQPLKYRGMAPQILSMTQQTATLT